MKSSEPDAIFCKIRDGGGGGGSVGFFAGGFEIQVPQVPHLLFRDISSAPQSSHRDNIILFVRLFKSHEKYRPHLYQIQNTIGGSAAIASNTYRQMRQ
jgi:hypothetical protein